MNRTLANSIRFECSRWALSTFTRSFHFLPVYRWVEIICIWLLNDGRLKHAGLDFRICASLDRDRPQNDARWYVAETSGSLL